MGDRERGGERLVSLREKQSPFYTVVDMQASELCPGPCPLLSSICSFLSATFYKLPGLSFTFPTKKRSDQLGPAEVSIMHTT